MGHGACRAQGSAQRARSGPYLHVAPPFRWWQRPTSTVHRSAASKPRGAGREAAPGAAPPPASPGSGEPGRTPPPSREERLALPSQHLLERPLGRQRHGALCSFWGSVPLTMSQELRRARLVLGQRPLLGLQALAALRSGAPAGAEGERGPCSGRELGQQTFPGAEQDDCPVRHPHPCRPRSFPALQDPGSHV